MAAIIRIKRSTTAVAPATLKTGELAYSAGAGLYNNGGDRLFFGKGDDGNGNATTVEVIGGAYFANLLDHQPGVLTASSAIVTDASSKLDNLKVDNIDINGNTISSTDTNGNIVLDPNGTGLIDVSTTRIINVVDPTSNQDAATKKYVDDRTGASATAFTIAGDAGGTDAIMGAETVTFAGDSDILTTISSNRVTFTHRPSSVTAGLYGSGTAIPVLRINKNGHVDSAGTVSIATTLNIGGDATSGSVSLISQTLTIAGGEGIDTTASGQTITIAGEDATISNKGIASFADSDFVVTAGAVRHKIATGTTRGTASFASPDFAISGLGAVTINNVNLGSQTSGNYVATVAATGGTGISVSGSGSETAAITLAGIDATTSVKGVASFADSDFIVTSGAVRHKIATTTARGTASFATADFTVSGLGAVSIANVNLGSQTTGNYTAAVAVGANTGLSISGTAGEGSTFTLSGVDATTSVKGVASFAAADFSVTSGAVSISNVNLGTQTSGNYVATVAATAGTGISVSGSGSETASITLAGIDATSSVKGVASFNATDFTVTSGAVTVNPIFVGTTRLDPGETDSSLAGLSSIEVGDVRIASNIISSRSTGILVIDPNPVGDSAGGYNGELIIRGNLTVQGTTTTVNSTTVSINDKNIVLADSAVNAAAADGAGLTVGGALYSGTKPSILFDAGTNRWDFNLPLDIGYATLDSAVLLNGIGLREVIEDHLVTNFFLEGEGIDLTYNDATNKLTVSAENATYTNLGVARFDSSEFTVTAGFVTIFNLDGGTY